VGIVSSAVSDYSQSMLPFCVTHQSLLLYLGQLMLLSLPVVITQAAMFGNFRGAGCVDHAQIWLDDDIRHRRVFGRVAKTKVCESLPRDDVLDSQVVTIAI